MIEARVSREEAHEWADRLLVSDDSSLPDDAMVRSALWDIHGFDMTTDHNSDPPLTRHGMAAGGTYDISDEEIKAGLERWLATCADHDADPEAWRARVLEQGRRRVAHERTTDPDTP